MFDKGKAGVETNDKLGAEDQGCDVLLNYL